MTLKKVLYRTRVRITDSWKKAFMMHPLLRIVFISLLVAQATPNTTFEDFGLGLKCGPPRAAFGLRMETRLGTI